MRRLGTGKGSTKGGDGNGEEVESWMAGVGASKAMWPACAPTVVECWLSNADVVSFGAAAVERGRLEYDEDGEKRALLDWGILRGNKETQKRRGERQNGSRGQREGGRGERTGVAAERTASPQLHLSYA